MRFYDPFKENLFRKMNLCQNIEQLVLQGRFMSDESFYGISQLPGLKTLKIGNVPRKILEIADWPNLERLWINALYYSDSEDYREDKFNDACIEKLIYNSSKLKSIHFDEPKQCNISNEFLFQTCKKTKIFISFGYGGYYYDNFKKDIKNCPRQLEMEKFFCKQEFDVYNKYQDMKDDFADWLNKDSPWFKCINLDEDTSD